MGQQPKRRLSLPARAPFTTAARGAIRESFIQVSSDVIQDRSSAGRRSRRRSLALPKGPERGREEPNTIRLNRLPTTIPR